MPEYLITSCYENALDSGGNFGTTKHTADNAFEALVLDIRKRFNVADHEACVRAAAEDYDAVAVLVPGATTESITRAAPFAVLHRLSMTIKSLKQASAQLQYLEGYYESGGLPTVDQTAMAADLYADVTARVAAMQQRHDEIAEQWRSRQAAPPAYVPPAGRELRSISVDTLENKQPSPRTFRQILVDDDKLTF